MPIDGMRSIASVTRVSGVSSRRPRSTASGRSATHCSTASVRVPSASCVDHEIGPHGVVSTASSIASPFATSMTSVRVSIGAHPFDVRQRVESFGSRLIAIRSWKSPVVLVIPHAIAPFEPMTMPGNARKREADEHRRRIRVRAVDRFAPRHARAIPDVRQHQHQVRIARDHRQAVLGVLAADDPGVRTDCLARARA